MEIKGVDIKHLVIRMGDINNQVCRDTDSEDRIYKLMEELYTALYFYYNWAGRIYEEK